MYTTSSTCNADLHMVQNSAGEQERGRVEETWPWSHLPPLPLPLQHAVQVAVDAEDVAEDTGVNEGSPKWW